MLSMLEVSEASFVGLPLGLTLDSSSRRGVPELGGEE